MWPAKSRLEGRSPRVRGSRWVAALPCRARRSIPACAGEPSCWRVRMVSPRVDPRVCGGARWRMSRRRAQAGRSPRVRGSHDGAVECLPGDRSIPACAGEPGWHDRSGGRGAVDPRVCGGAPGIRRGSHLAGGRSPRVRGSPGAWSACRWWWRSIPACAGEPNGQQTLRHHPGVDPRVCGGAYAAVPADVTTAGRSPRVRGSRL